MIKFKTIKWKNFLSTGNYWTEISLDHNQHTLIVGTNGSGKSTMLDALCFALFGKPFRNINKPNLVNSINKKECDVELTFDTDNKSYRIVRGIKPGIFEIHEDGILLNQDASIKDYQDYLEKFVVKMNLKSFRQIVVLGSASFVPFMQLSASDRRSIIEDLLDIQIFSIMNNILKDKVSINKDTITELKNKSELILQKYELEKKHLNQLKQNTEELINNYQMEVDAANDTIRKLISSNTTLNKNVDELTDSATGKTKVEAKIKEINKLSTKIESNLSKFTTDIHFFHHNDNCPTCKQVIDGSVKEREIIRLKAKADESNTALLRIEQKLTEEQQRLDNITELQKQIQKIQIEIATNNSAISETNKYIQKALAQIEALKGTKNTNDRDQDTLEKLSDELLTAKKELKKLVELRNYYDAAAVLLKDNGIKTKIIKQYLPIINKLVNKYLSSLDFFVNFNLDESFKEVIKSRHRDEFEYNNFSEGEKQRIDMALMLTWRAVAKLKNSVNTNLLILDEVFDSSLDNNGTEYLMNILQMLDNVNLFVISHKGDILQDKFANVIRFEKTKNFSRMIK